MAERHEQDGETLIRAVVSRIGKASGDPAMVLWSEMRAVLPVRGETPMVFASRAARAGGPFAPGRRMRLGKDAQAD